MKHFLTALTLALLLSSPVFGQMLRPVRDSRGLYGFENENGVMVVKPQYDSIKFNFYQGTACVVKDGKFLLLDTSGKAISKNYTWISTFDSHDLCLVNSGGKMGAEGLPVGGKFGCVDLKGNEIIPAKYDFVGDFNNENVAIVRSKSKTDGNGNLTGGKFGFVDITGRIVTKPKYAYVGQAGEDGLSLVNVGGRVGDDGVCYYGRFGYVNARGEEIVQPAYDFIGTFDSDGFCWVNKGGHPYGVVTSSMDKEYDNSIDAAVKKECAGETDKEVIFAKRAEIENRILGERWDPFGNRIMGGRFGFVNRSGKVVIPVKYTDSPAHLTEGRFVMGLFDNYFVFDETGRIITKRMYTVTQYKNGLAVIKGYVNHVPCYGLMDRDGNVVTAPEYAGFDQMESGLVVAKAYDIGRLNIYVYNDLYSSGKLRYKYGLLGGRGQKLTPAKYDAIKISNGVARCILGKYVGYVDSLGREILPPSLLKGNAFEHNSALVMLCGQDLPLNSRGSHIVTRGGYGTDDTGAKWGLIDRGGIALTDFIYDNAYGMREGLIPVEVSGVGWGWIDANGKTAIPLQYESAGNFFSGYAFAKLNGRYGVIDRDNNVVVDFAYDGISNHFHNHRIFCVKQVGTGKWGGCDEDGDLVIPMEFDSSDDVDKAADEVYVPNGCVKLTSTEVRRFKIRLANIGQHFKVEDTIPENYWDY